MDVSELEDFPFSSFNEYQAASSIGVAGLRVDTEIAIKLAGAGRFGRIPQAFALTMLTVPWVIAIFNLGYDLLRNTWLLIGLPLLLVAFFLSHPAMAFVRRTLRPLMYLLIVSVGAASAYALFIAHHPGIMLLGASILAIVAANLALLSLSVKLMIRKANSDEEFLCALWRSNALRLTTADRREFSPDTRQASVSDHRDGDMHEDAHPLQIKNNKFAFQGKRNFTKGDWQIPSAFGIHFNVATLQPEVGPEVILLLSEHRAFLTELRNQGPYQLRLNSGIVNASAGPIIFLLWWFPPLIDGKPFAGYELLISPKPGPSGVDLLTQVASQTHLHLVILDGHQDVFGVVEFENTYGLGGLVAATKKIGSLPTGYDFFKAKEAFLREIPQESLL
jgi:hypothetical protein